MNGYDLVETADFEDFPDRIRKRAQCERGIPLLEQSRDQQDDPKARAAYVGQGTEIQQHLAVVFTDGAVERVFEFPRVGAVDSTFNLRNKYFIYSVDTDLHETNPLYRFIILPCSAKSAICTP